MTATLSDGLAALAEKLAADLSGNRGMAFGPIYSALLRMRDDAVLLEAIAGERGTAVRLLISDLDNQCERLAALTAFRPEMEGQLR